MAGSEQSRDRTPAWLRGDDAEDDEVQDGEVQAGEAQADEVQADEFQAAAPPLRRSRIERAPVPPVSSVPRSGTGPAWDPVTPAPAAATPPTPPTSHRAPPAYRNAPDEPPTREIPRYVDPPEDDLAAPPGLDQINLVRRRPRAPRSGWRRWVYLLTGGLVDPGESPAQLRLDDAIARTRVPLSGNYKIAVLSMKGGVGKTTTTIGLGSMFAHYRGDRVIAVDANPDLGTLGARVSTESNSTVRGLLEAGDLGHYSAVRGYTVQADSRLEVIASERNPDKSESFGENDYRQVVDILQRHYNIVLTDCGTGLTHSAMKGTLDLADAIILVTSPAIDGAQSASATLDWLNHHGYRHLVSKSVVVISASKPGSAPVDVSMMGEHFLGRARAVQVVPYDSHLAEGSSVELDLLDKRTHAAFVELAATVADGFPGANTANGRKDRYGY
ncbi:MAG: AAA family ATPase [Rhodococcus sp. (in: high G+C Gram-positive bacteria)]